MKHTYSIFSQRHLLLLFSVFLFTLLISHLSYAAQLTTQQVQSAVETWVRYSTADAKPDAVIERMEPYQVDGETIAYIAHIKDGGFCIAGTDDYLSLPVYIYSPSGKYDPENLGFQSVLNNIAEVTRKMQQWMDNNDPQLQDYSDELNLRKSLWQQLLEGKQFLIKGELPAPPGEAPQQVTLPLTTSWHQGAPYNNLTPNGDGGRTVVGCVATAAAQIMRYWQWPQAGVGSSSYTWNGDQSCGNDVGGGVLSANYSDPYDWQNMPDDCTGGCTTAEQNALAELSYEIGVSVTMNYGVCISTSDLWRLVTGTSPLINHFLYHIEATYNSDHELPHTYDDRIITELQWFRPVALGGCLNTGGGHAWVALGYNSGVNPPQFLMNMGWGNPDVWSTRDGVSGCHNYVTQIAPADGVKFVSDLPPGPYPDRGTGSPALPYNHIEEALDSVSADTTLIFRAGSDNLFASSSLVIDRPMVLKGINATINKE